MTAKTNPPSAQYVHRTVREVLREQAARHGEKPFLTFVPTGAKYSFRLVDESTSDLAARLAAFGIGKGSRVVMFMDNSPDMVLLFFALAKAGAVAAPVNTAAKGQLLQYYLQLADPAAVFVSARYIEMIEPMARAQGIALIVSVGDPSPPATSTAIPYERITGAAETAELPETCFSDLALLLFTSGTTGPSKAIMIPQAQAVYWGGDIAFHHEFESTDIDYVCLPLFHGNSLLNSTFAALVAGSSIVLTEQFSVSKFWEEVREHRVTRVLLIGAMINFLWTRPPGPADRDHCLRIVGLAPAPKYASDFLQRFGVRGLTGYGLTDFAMASVLAPTTDAAKLASNGRPRRGITIKIVDDSDIELGPGQVGEIVLRSENAWGISQGYFRNNEATVAANRNQWFHTGDNGYLDAGGYLYFLDRKKDAIRRRGENISAYEVEEIINLHSAVQQSAVYAVKSEHGEDEVVASIALIPGASAQFEEIIRHCADNMAYFMVPRYLEFVDSLPKTPSAKVEKYKLRERAMADRGHLWDREAAGIIIRRR